MSLIEKLHPSIRTMAQQFLDAAKKEGIELKITFGYRTFPEQQALYDKGRTPESIAKGEEIVTKAKPGQSFHNYGLAIDVVEIKDKKAIWENPHWNRIGEIGESVGFEWGGRWKFVDKPHFQFPKNTKYTALLALKNAGKVDQQGFVILPS